MFLRSQIQSRRLQMGESNNNGNDINIKPKRAASNAEHN